MLWTVLNLFAASFWAFNLVETVFLGKVPDKLATTCAFFILANYCALNAVGAL